MTGNTATTDRPPTSPTRGPQRYGKGGKRIRPAAGNVSSPYWAAPTPTAPRSAPPASPAPPASTAASSTGTATCSTRSTPSRPPHRPPGTHPARPSPAPPCRPTCSPPANAAQRLNSRVRQLEKRLSEALGEKAWQESGLGVPADIDALNQTINHLEQQVIDLRLQLDERDQDLAAARAANRELIAQLNTATRHR